MVQSLDTKVEGWAFEYLPPSSIRDKSVPEARYLARPQPTEGE